MRTSYRLFLPILALLFNLNLVFAQETALSKEYKEQVITTLSQLMNNYYVFPEVAKQTEEHLKKQLADGYYDSIETDEAFAAALTESVQSINKDKHMRIRKNRPYVAPDNSPERLIEEHLDQRDRSRRNNAGFVDVKILEDNVGYLDLRGFAGLETGKAVADAYMKLMSRTDAIIIDLSKNGGGSPAMVQYLCSYFFDDHRHLNSLYWREGDVTQEFWTLDKVGGEKMPEIPLFVMTSDRTFSGAEEFSYNMQTQKRATLVGQTTGGGANPGGARPINESLSVFIPGGRAINPITQTNWEGVGVVPEVQTSAENAFDKTYELARQAAETYRAQQNEQFSKLLTNLNSQLDEYSVGTSEEAIFKNLKACQDVKLLDEADINALGYTYLMEHQKPKIAACIFRSNTILNPDSPNVYDSYAECLMTSGDLKTSLKNYEKAVELAVKNEDPNVDLFKENLEKLKEQMKG